MGFMRCPRLADGRGRWQLGGIQGETVQQTCDDIRHVSGCEIMRLNPWKQAQSGRASSCLSRGLHKGKDTFPSPVILGSAGRKRKGVDFGVGRVVEQQKQRQG